ncbi:hypothetical protein ASZ90_016459 [hydrocarbon metagenome]|uniref:Uncharacterized protein n=1 Tax=hydrocarbon metagenome TaxID=938273 RepID=A0A0W8EUG4_9ZZZZ
MKLFSKMRSFASMQGEHAKERPLVTLIKYHEGSRFTPLYSQESRSVQELPDEELHHPVRGWDSPIHQGLGAAAPILSGVIETLFAP